MSRTLAFAGLLAVIALTISGCSANNSGVNESPADLVSQTNEGTFGGNYTVADYMVSLQNGRLSLHIDAENANMQLAMSLSMRHGVAISNVLVEAILNATSRGLTVHLVADLSKSQWPVPPHIDNCSHVFVGLPPPAVLMPALKRWVQKLKPSGMENGERKFERSIDVHVSDGMGEVEAHGIIDLDDDQVMHNMHFDATVKDDVNGSENASITVDYHGTVAKKGANASAFVVPAEWNCTGIESPSESKFTAEMIPVMLFELLNSTVKALGLPEQKLSEVVV